MPATSRVFWRLVLTYVLDWVLIIIIAAVGGSLSFLAPTHRPFSLVDLRISYPYTPSSISTSILVVVSLIIPLLIIAVVSLLFLPHFTLSSAVLRDRHFLLRKFWELNAGWLGLGLSYASALLLTQMVKQTAGRPRPDLLARCGPDATAASSHYVGGDGQAVASTWILVDYKICTVPYGQSELDDGFRSFFSGHSSSAFSGLLYLSLWLAVKCNITLPHWNGPSADHGAGDHAARGGRLVQDAVANSSSNEDDNEHHHARHERHSTTADDELRTAGAAAPVWGFIVFFVPILVALYIALTRYREYKHGGIDISTGIGVGCFTAYMGFRSYHASLRRGRTWTWAPRQANSAFWPGTSGWQKIGDDRDGAVAHKRDDARQNDNRLPTGTGGAAGTDGGLAV